MPRFSFQQSQLSHFAEQSLSIAAKLGCQAVAKVSEGFGLDVRVRNRGIEAIERNQDKGLSITVYLNQRQGNAHTSDFSSAAIESTVQAAYDIARFTEADPCAGLPEAELLAKNYQSPELFFPWELDAEQAIDIAKRAEDAALQTSALITNSEGASVSTHQSQFFMCNTAGFRGGYAYTSHDLSCTLIAGRDAGMQRDYWYSSQCDPQQLASPEVLGRYAAERTLARLHSRKISTRSCPVLFEAPLAAGLLGAFVHAVSGSSLYRRASFLLDSVGQQVFPQHIEITEDPNVAKAVGSCPFDGEGVKTQARSVVTKGVVNGYFLSCYSARKLGLVTTGNAGGAHNLEIRSHLTQPQDNLDAMLRKMDTGLLVTELLGHASNIITGDYSCGAAGYWVESGKIAYPVNEITIAGNLKDMFQNLVAIGADRYVRGSKTTGSILLEQMRVGGA